MATIRPIRPSIVAEAECIANDEADRAEMRTIREQMAELAPAPID
jgi:hypothetical protein